MCLSNMAGEESLLRIRDAFGWLDRESEPLGSIPALEAGLVIVWQRSVPRFTPADKRNAFALGLRGGDGFLCSFCTG
jgi:hypothetical protein